MKGAPEMEITDKELCLSREDTQKFCSYLRELADNIEEYSDAQSDDNDEINLFEPMILPVAPLAPWIIRGIIIGIVRAATIQDAH